MRRSNRWSMTILGALVALCLGCGSSEKPDAAGKAANGGNPPAGGTQTPDVNVDVPAKPEPPPVPTIPDVHLDTSLEKTCVVKVGDVLPAAELPDLAGKPHPINEFFGTKATVVVFWNNGMQSLQELDDLGRDVIEKFADKGIGTVTVNVGSTADQLGPLLESVTAKAPILLDADGSYFGKVATEHFPRTYVLDGEGKIRWFDTEYSESTRRNMTETIEAILLEKEAP